MRARYVLAVCLLAGVAAAAAAEPKVLPKRWVYVSRSLRADRDVDDIRQIVQTASEHGLNGMLFAGGFDRMDLQPPEYFERLKKVKEACDKLGVEIVPTGFNVGYGGALMAHDRHLAAGLPVKDALFVARGGEARFEPDSPAAPAAGVFEGRAEQVVAVKPYRSYRLRVRVRAEGAAPGALLGIRALAGDKRNLCFFEGRLAASPDWREVTTGFNSWYADKVTLSVGAAEGKFQKLSIDGLRIEEVGLVNVVRRQGTPVRVRGEQSGTVYEEGRDFDPILDPKMDFRFDHDSPSIKLLPATRIRDGEKLRVDYYHGTTIYRDQVGACMSDPKVMEIWRKQFPLVEKHVAPKTYLLALDEVRVGGFCESCRGRNKSMAAMLGEYATDLHAMIRQVNPKAEIFVWSDMFDPNHNSRPKYYLVDGDYTGSWEYLPKDMQIACWYFERRRLSLDHFSKLGFKTLAGSYYDADDLKNPEGWLEALDQTPGAVGIMYTTWQNKYKLLAPFGDLVSRRK
jgi:hypothetical protein